MTGPIIPAQPRNGEAAPILPARPQLREAYTALLSHIYLFRRDVMLLGEIQRVIAGCGVTPETADNWCRELSNFKLIEYVTSSVLGHWYVVRLFTKNEKEIHCVDTWQEFDQVIREHFGDIAECDLALIRLSMNAQEESGAREQAITESERLQRGTNILPGGDVIRSEFKTLEKETEEEVASRVEEALAKNKEKPGSGSEFLGED